MEIIEWPIVREELGQKWRTALEGEMDHEIPNLHAPTYLPP